MRNSKVILPLVLLSTLFINALSEKSIHDEQTPTITVTGDDCCSCSMYDLQHVVIISMLGFLVLTVIVGVIVLWLRSASNRTYL